MSFLSSETDVMFGLDLDWRIYMPFLTLHLYMMRGVTIMTFLVELHVIPNIQSVCDDNYDDLL